MTRKQSGKHLSGSVDERTTPVDLAQAETAVRDLLSALGLDPNHPALATTPARTAEAFAHILTAGYATDPSEALGGGFPTVRAGTVVVTRIPALFVCPHHLMPARAEIHLAFWPSKRVPGLSRLTRLVDALGRRLVLQEDLGVWLVDALVENLDVEAAVAIIEAQHTCVFIEDLARRDTIVRTRATRGPEARIAVLQSEIDATLSARWSTSVSEPPASGTGSRSPSFEAAGSMSKPNSSTVSNRPVPSPLDDS